MLARSQARTCSTRCRVALHRRARREQSASPYPEALAGRDRWVRAEGKRPITVTGRPASSTNPATWATYAAVSTSSAGDGLGIMLGAGLACYDLDGCLVDGALTDDARELINGITAEILFTEVSVSGRGLHIFTAEPEAKSHQGRWGGHYLHSRFIRTTGKRFDLKETTNA